MAITENAQIKVCSILCMLIAQPVSCFLLNSPSMSIGPLSSSPVTYVMSRNEAYYVNAIPFPSGPNLLGFDWNVSVSYPSTGQGSIQFSHDNLSWSNLASYYLILGEAQGKQTIDSSWARPGTNYLRASYNQSSSVALILKVYVGYVVTILIVLSPFVAAGAVGAAIYFVRKRNRQSLAITT